MAPDLLLAKTANRWRHRVDPFLAVAAVIAAAVGVVIVYSASRGVLEQAGQSPTFYLKRQLLFVILGLICMVGITALNFHYVEIGGIIIYWITVVALLGVLVPGVGKHALGSTRWYSFGALQIQPSELAVLGLTIGVSTFCSRRSDGLGWRDLGKVLAMGALPMGLVLIQPDLGTAVIMAVILGVLLAVAGLPNRLMLLLIAGIIGILVIAFSAGLLHHYQVTRITSFLHQSTAHPSRTLKAAIYNLSESKQTIGSGGFSGTGLFHSSQINLGYVPEQQTDFIFTAIAQQLGFFGSIGVLVLLGALAWRCLVIAKRTRDQFGRLIAMGVMAFIAFSTFQNAGMTMGIMPITGIPLPFMSYGGTAVIVFFAGIGMVLSVAAIRSD